MPNAPRLARSLVALACLVLTVGAFGFAPEPDPVPTRWQLQIDPGPLRVATVQTERGPRKYLYFTYTVTNYWGEDLLFFPDVELKTDDATVQRSGRDVPAAVQDEIIRRLNDPLLEDQISVVGQVLQGPENARTGLAIWPAIDLDVDEVVIFFAGLSGENKAYVVTTPDGQRERFNLRKTLMLRYDTPGEFGYRDNEQLDLAERVWVMR